MDGIIMGNSMDSSMDNSMETILADVNNNKSKVPRNPLAAAYAYANNLWLLANLKKSISTFEPLLSLAKSAIEQLHNKLISEEEYKAYLAWANTCTIGLQNMRSQVQKFEGPLARTEAAYQQSRIQADLPIFKPEFDLNLHISPRLLQTCKYFDLRRATVILCSERSFFEKAELEELLESGHQSLDPIYWSAPYTDKDERHAMLQLVRQKNPLKLRWLPLPVAQMLNRDQDGTRFDDKEHRLLNSERLSFSLISLSAKQVDDLEKFIASDYGRSSAMHSASNSIVTLDDEDDGTEDDDIEDDDIEDDDFEIPSTNNTKANTPAQRQHGRPSTSTTSTTYRPLSIPDPYPNQYKPTPQSAGRNKAFRGNPPPKKGGGFLDDAQWIAAYRSSYSYTCDVKYRRQLTRREFKRGELQAHGFLRWEAVEKLKKEGKVDMEFIDGVAFW